MSAVTTEEFRVRIDKVLVRQAKRVAAEIGTTPGDVVRLVFAQMVKRRAIPFPLQADSPEDEVLGPPARRGQIWDQMESGELNNPNAKSSAR
jgi:addiction module RelB/DinJ family antitoxin